MKRGPLEFFNWILAFGLACWVIFSFAHPVISVLPTYLGYWGDTSLHYEVVQRIQANDREGLKAIISESLRDDLTVAKFEQLRRVTPAGPAGKPRQFGFEAYETYKPGDNEGSPKTATQGKATRLIWEQQFGEREWLGMDITVKKYGDESYVSRFYLTPFPESRYDATKAHDSSLSKQHYWLIALGLVGVLFMLTCLWICMRTYMWFKAVWLMLIITGVGSLTLIGDGTWQTSLTAEIPAVNAGDIAGPAWNTVISIPLGAIVFLAWWFVRRTDRWRRAVNTRVWWIYRGANHTPERLSEPETPAIG